MTFLAPWALFIAAAAAAGTVVLHLVARQRPAAYLLPTARFIPDRRTLVSRVARVPRDLLLLVMRVLLLLAAGAAFARPVLTPRRAPLARVILLDVSRAQGSITDAVLRARKAAAGVAPVRVIAFDTSAATIALTSLDSLTRRTSRAPGSISVALIAARRVALELAESADSVALIIVSPLDASETDAATHELRHAWSGAIRVERTSPSTDSARTWRLERPLAASDPLAPALVGAATSGSVLTVRLVRSSLSASDSAFARAGGTVVRWDTAHAATSVAEGLAVGDNVVVAPLGRTAIPAAGTVTARWADGHPAAIEQPLGAGCLREVGIALPAAGDLPLHPRFQQIVRALLSPCGLPSIGRPLDSAGVAQIAGVGGAATPLSAVGLAADETSSLARWLLAIALGLALLELLVRARLSVEAEA